MASYTLTQLQTALEERWDSAVFWAASDATNALNETFRVWNLLTGQWRTRDTSLTTVADQVYYTLPSTLYHATRVEFGGAQISRGSIAEFDAARPNWESETTASGSDVPTTVQAWGAVGVTQFALWPADHIGGTTLTVDGLEPAPRLSAGSDTIQFNAGLLPTFLGMALHLAAFKYASTLFTETFPFYQQFIAEAGDLNDRLKDSGLYRRALNLDPERVLDPLRTPSTPLDLLEPPALWQQKKGGASQ